MQVCKIMDRNIFILKKGKNAFKIFFKKKKDIKTQKNIIKKNMERWKENNCKTKKIIK